MKYHWEIFDTPKNTLFLILLNDPFTWTFKTEFSVIRNGTNSKIQTRTLPCPSPLPFYASVHHPNTAWNAFLNGFSDIVLDYPPTICNAGKIRSSFQLSCNGVYLRVNRIKLTQVLRDILSKKRKASICVYFRTI